MKRLSLFILLLCTTCVSLAQSQTILLAETNRPYSAQEWFCSGNGGLQGDKIKSLWDKGKRITSVAYTRNGWFVVMAQNSGLTEQTYRQSADWPKDFIKEQWDKDYYITSMTYGSGQWLVVMSLTPEYTDQTWIRNSWSEVATWIKENWDSGYYITDVKYNSAKWTVVMSKTDQFTHQGYAWANSLDEVKSKAQSNIWGESNNVQLIEYGASQYLIVYCKYASDNDRGQNYIINPSDLNDYIQTRWNNSQQITYVGGGDGASASASPASTTTAPAPSDTKVWREELGYGGFVIVSDRSGIITRTRYRLCPNCRGTQICASCHGTGQCGLCNGQGGIITPGYGQYIPCYLCRQTGVCNMCKGTGRCFCQISDYPGYVIAGTSTIFPNGEVISDKVDYNERDSDPRESSPSGGTCNKCHGRKYESTPYKHAAASISGWAQPYHNSAGSNCPYCNENSDHYHYPCSECRGFGHN